MIDLFEECKANAIAYDKVMADAAKDTITLTLPKQDIDNLIIILSSHAPNWQAELIARDIAHRIMRQTINAPTNKE